MVTVTEAQVRRLRLRGQRLDARGRAGEATVAEVVAAAGGLQAQERPAAALGVRARSAGLVAADVERARVDERSVVLTWGQRGTLHLLATEDAGWMLPLLGPVFRAAGRRRRAELGLDDARCERGAALMGEALAEKGPLTRGDLAELLAAAGIPTEGQATFHLIAYAALSGLLCYGPDRGREQTFVPLADRVRAGKSLPREAALGELARRYLAAYGPATPADFAAWSGLSRGDARTGWDGVAGDLVAVVAEGRELWMPKAQAERLDEEPTQGPGVRLLPRYDTLLLGYRGREWLVAPEYARRVHPGGGIINATVLVDGHIAGTWRVERKRDRLAVVAEPFGELPSDVLSELEAEVEDVGRFLGQKAAPQIRPGQP